MSNRTVVVVVVKLLEQISHLIDSFVGKFKDLGVASAVAGKTFGRPETKPEVVVVGDNGVAPKSLTCGPHTFRVRRHTA